MTVGTRLIGATLLSGCVLFAACGRGCGAGPVVEGGDPLGAGGVEAESGPPAMSPGTLRALGPHTFDASLEIRGDRAGRWPSREVVARLVWADLDVYAWEATAGGRSQREVQIEGDLYRRQSNGGRYVRSDGPRGNAIVHQQTLGLWEEAVGPFAARIAWRRLGEHAVEGRPAVAWKVELAPPPTLPGEEGLGPDEAADRLGQSTDVLALSGTVYVDAETGNRVLAELDGRFVGRAIVGSRDPTDEVHVAYRERRTVAAVPPTVEAPPPEQVVQQQRRMRPAGAK